MVRRSKTMLQCGIISSRERLGSHAQLKAPGRGSAREKSFSIAVESNARRKQERGPLSCPHPKADKADKAAEAGTRQEDHQNGQTERGSAAQTRGGQFHQRSIQWSQWHTALQALHAHWLNPQALAPVGHAPWLHSIGFGLRVRNRHERCRGRTRLPRAVSRAGGVCQYGTLLELASACQSKAGLRRTRDDRGADAKRAHPLQG